MKNLISEELEEQLDELYSEEEYDEELEYYDEETEDLAQDETEGARFVLVDHHRRAESFYRLSDGNTTSFANIVLEYFGNRCALSGEKFVIFDEDIVKGEYFKLSSNLSAEHVIALAIGGDDIAPNIVPAVYQYNLKKNGYYILDWWTKQNDINGKPLYTPERLLKLINFMLKSLAARKSGKQSNIEEYRAAILTPNAIDKYLSQLELEDETLDNSERKILSDTITATTIIDDKKLLTKIPQIDGSIPEHKLQVEDREKTYQDTHMVEYFLFDAIKLIKEDRELGSKEEIITTLDNMYENIEGTLSHEVIVRNYILELLNELGVKNNQYTIANDWLANTNILQNSEGKTKEEIKKEVRNLIENFKNKYDISEENLPQILSVNPSVIYDKDIDKIIKLWERYNSEQADKSVIFEAKTINIYYVLQIAQWAEENKRLPRKDSKEADEEEKRLGQQLHRIRQWLKQEKVGSNEIKQIIEELDEKYNELRIKYGNELVQLVQIRKIKEWAEMNERLPSSVAKDMDERRLGQTLGNIRDWIKQEKEGSKEIRKIIEELDEKYKMRGTGLTQLTNAKKLKKWVEENSKLPSQHSEDKEEKSFSGILYNLRDWIKQEREGSEEIRKILEELEEKYKMRGTGLTQLANARMLKNWVERNGKLPSHRSKVEEEKKLSSMRNALKNWIKQMKDGNEEVMEEVVEQVRKILEELDEKYKGKKTKSEDELIQLVQIKEIAEWAEEHGWLPRKDSKEADKEEKRLGGQVNSIRTWIKKGKEGSEKVRQILEDLDSKYNERKIKYGNELIQLVQIKEIAEWVEKNKRLPRRDSKEADEEEKRLGQQLHYIRQWLKKGKEGNEEIKQILEDLDEKYNEIRVKYGNELVQLVQIRKIKEWAEMNERLPSPVAKAMDERRLGQTLGKIRDWIKKGKEGSEEVRVIIEELDSKYNERKIKYGNELIQLVQIKEIKEWAELNDKLPSQTAKDIQENQLGVRLNSIRQWIKKEKEGSEKVRQILEELDSKYNERKIKYGNELIQLVQIKEIKKWVEENGRLPSEAAKTEEEKKLGKILSNIRTWLKKGKEGSEEVRAIIEELDAKYKKKRTGQEIGQATFDVPAEQCDKASRHLQQLQTREVVH